MEAILEPVRVMYVLASGGFNEAKAAFEALESKLDTMKGRRFYGVISGGEYMACVRLEERDNPKELGLGVFIIPAGKYAKELITEWEGKLDSIATTFQAMADKFGEDKSRPRIEFYRSQKELILLLPIA